MDYEKLGLFYLGKNVNPADEKLTEDLTLYDSKDLVTHALAVGMTGSGKTGLCVGIIEEAAIDGVPSIVIDPKGDLTNLLLTFPNMTGEDLLPWINSEEARKKELTPESFAAKQAEMWKNGLASWGQGLDRITRLKDAADFAIYTPGSTAGIPVSIMKTLSAPDGSILDDEELFQEKVSSTVASFLTLLKIDADPLTSREHILLSNILNEGWKAGVDLDLPTLISNIQKPAFTKIGVLDIETFYPQKERMGLAMLINNLIASPSFATWMNGEPLNITNMLYTSKGKPRVSIFSIAHLTDPERMFFVTLLLNQVLAWARSQSGTSSLRALLYMDEIYGYFPPVENPPSKKPLISLLKQARAFGLGLVLSTQNPVDIDYKGLGNIGTWFIGRLQTERDKQKMLEGLESASETGAFNRALFDKMISGLGKRVFLMNNVHEDQPVLFQTRWVLSYLAGPLTRDQIKKLSPKKLIPATEQTPPPNGKMANKKNANNLAPIIPAGIEQYYLIDRSKRAELTYSAKVLAGVSVNYSHSKSRISTTVDQWLAMEVDPDAIHSDWADAEILEISIRDLSREPESGAKFSEISDELTSEKNFKGWSTDLVNYLYRDGELKIYYDPASKAYSEPGESEQDFIGRNRHSRREQRDEAVESLRKKYATKIHSAEERVRKAGLAVEREKEQASQAKIQTALSFGSTLLGALSGRKLISSSNISRAGTAFRGVSRSMEQGSDVERSKSTLETYEADLKDLELELEKEIEALENSRENIELEEISVRPKKTDIDVRVIGILWIPE